MQGAEVEMEGFLSNYKEVNGMVVPHYIENRMNGEVMSSVTIESIVFDEDIDADLFKKPVAPAAPATPEMPKK
ncbi:MAG: hypothetical protein B7C24_07415 [Bacteroidetes bacterium 4572_77]|nr:MAG: hypothetical protein B7C24_07415 [Bacteroidetes bacterium 4572_77]